MDQYANAIEAAVQETVAEGKYLTRDVGGSSTTKKFTEAVISKLTKNE